MRQSVLIALAGILGAVALEAWADRGAFRGHFQHHPSVRLPSAITRLPAYSQRWGQSGSTVTRRHHAPKGHPRKFLRRHAHPPYVYYGPAYIAPLVVYPLPEVPDAQGYPYFCPENRRYYPDVRDCPSGWLAVLPGASGPPDPSRR